MTALSADRETAIKGGIFKSYPCGVDVIYKGGLVAIDADGYAVAAANTAGLRVVGIADEKVDNSAGSAGDKEVKVRRGCIAKLVATSITQAMVGSHMYVADDQTFDDTATNGVIAGILVEYVSATSGWILVGPEISAASPRLFDRFVTKDDDYTVTPEDNGTIFAIATDAKAFTLPATQMGLIYGFVNTGADGAVKLSVSPQAADAIHYVTSVDDKDLINTKATAIEGDMVVLVGDGDEGWFVLSIKGTWAKE